MNRSALLLLAALVAAGCGGSVLPPRNAAGDGEVAELKQRILELQRRAAVQQVELARLRERVAELEAHAGGAGFETRAGGATATRPAPPPGGRHAPAPPPSPEPAASEPAFEIAEVLEDEEIDADELEDTGAAEPTVPPPARREPPAAAAPPPREMPPPDEASRRPPSPAAQALYDQGYTLFHQGRFIDAESAFRRFLQEHPDNDHADNAQYWIGEARYARDDLRGALAAFRETVAHHPHGNKVPDALLKAGQCLEKLGDREGARETYRELARRFPESAAAVVAEERLAGG
jgi:tol-pal system protein YbgF